MAADDAYMLFRGLRVHLRIVEPDDRLTRRVFVLPSPFTCAFNWRKITPELAQLGCMTVIMDLPGFGESTCGQDVPNDIRLFSNVGWGVIDEIDSALGVTPGSWHIIGHGYASQVALDMANEHPDSVSSQVFITPVMGKHDLIVAQRLDSAKWYEKNIRDRGGYLKLLESMFGKPVESYVADRMRVCLERNGARASCLKMLEAKPSPIRAIGFLPTMTIWGGRDLMTGEKSRRDMGRLVPESETHVLKTSGHMPMETHSHALKDFLRGWFNYLG